MKLCQKWPLIHDIIQAITLQAESPDTANVNPALQAESPDTANVNLTRAQDVAAEDSDEDVSIVVESTDSEDDYEEQTSGGNTFKKLRVNS